MDAGLQVLTELHEVLSMEEDWTIRSPRGFRWYSGPMAHEVAADPPFLDHGVQLSRVRIETEVLQGFVPDSRGVDLVSRFGTQATLSGYVLGEGSLRLCTSAYVHEETARDWTAFLLIAMALQVDAAYRQADTLAELLGASVSFAAHPEHGPRQDLHEIASTATELVAPRGEEISRFVGGGFEYAKRVAGPHVSVLTNADRTGLTAEFPFGAQTALFQMLPTVTNPALGSGMLMLLKLPTAIPGMSPVESAARLNRLEQMELTRSPYIGSWCASPTDEAITFVTFVPNILANGDGLILNLFAYAAARAKWVLESVFGGDHDKSMDVARPAMHRMLFPDPPPERRGGLFRRPK